MLWSALAKAAPAVPYFVGILAFILAMHIMGHRFGPKKRRGRRKRDSDWRYQPRHDTIPPRVPDAADQLRTVMRAEFKAQRLLNKSETRLFKAIDKMVLEMRPGWQVMAQVSLGEILRCEDKDAYACINSKRVDLLIVDDECRPLHAIEYQGDGHHQGTAAARDAVKKEALRRAGIGYVEVVAGDTPTELRRVVERLVLSNVR
jgi:hypothetical protein